MERYCELANKTTQQLYKVATPCQDDHEFKDEEIGSVGEMSTVCSQIALKCLYLARIGRPDIWWSVNKLACAVTKWTKSCDKRLVRLMSYIHHTIEDRQYCYVGNQQCGLGLFQDSDFAGDLEWMNSKHLWKSHVCAEKLDVQDTVFSFAQFLQKLRSCLSMQVYAWTVFPLSLCGIW